MYSPTKKDIAWAWSITRLVVDGGLWVWASFGAVFEFDHEAKTLAFKYSVLELPKDALERTKATFEKIGYRFINEEVQ